MVGRPQLVAAQHLFLVDYLNNEMNKEYMSTKYNSLKRFTYITLNDVTQVGIILDSWGYLQMIAVDEAMLLA